MDKPEGWLILGESSEDLSMFLWLAVRRVLCWIDTPGRARKALSSCIPTATAELSHSARALVPELTHAIDRLALLRRAPHVIPPEEIAGCCHTIAEWADGRALFGTAAEFAEAAAKALPQKAAYATLAGRACRRAGRSDRAAIWYQRGFLLALRAEDSPGCIRALLGYGKLLLDQGSHLEARRFFRRAARRAHYIGKRKQAAAAYHDLFTIAAELGHRRDACEMVTKAVRLYPIHHPQVPALAHDLSFYLLRQRYYSSAQTLLRETLPRLLRIEDQLIGWATFARLVALLGDQDQWRAAVQQARARLKASGVFAAAANIHLAEGARALGLWTEAKARANRALRLAHARGERSIEADARHLLRAIEAHDPVQPEATPPQSEKPALDAALAEMIARLRRWQPLPRVQPQCPEPIV